MLRFLRLQNWKSYYEPVEFTMVATRERRHGDRLARVGRSRILPVAAKRGRRASRPLVPPPRPFIEVLDQCGHLR